MTTERLMRQQPGYACEECRRRKARCDRVRPKCGFCAASGLPCTVVEKRQQRGSRKCQLELMKSEIETLRWYLSHHRSKNVPVPASMVDQESDPQNGINMMADDAGFDMQLNNNRLHDLDTSLSFASPITTSTFGGLATPANSEDRGVDLPDWLACLDWGHTNNGNSLVSTSTDHSEVGAINSGPPAHEHSATRIVITDLIRSELDQLYFDRVHTLCPIIHRRRYFAWATHGMHTPSQTCLQSAMRTVAAAMSAHSCHLSDQLCTETRNLLEAHGQTGAAPGENTLKYIQAWLLLSYYELLRIGVHQAMITAGRALRLVQMMHLSDVDSPRNEMQLCLTPPSPECSISSSSTSAESGEKFVDAEERRRTFWLAFILDRLLCLHNEWPLTLQEEMICTRLPAHEDNFQNNMPITTSFLSEAVDEDKPGCLSPFAQCTVMAALQGRCMKHRRTFAKESKAGAHDFWTSQKLLAASVERQLQTLAPSAAVDNDPMLLFNYMLAYRATIDLSDTVERAPWHAAGHQPQAMAYRRRASSAAFEIVNLARAVPCMSCFRAHPFLPDLLACAAVFLSEYFGGPEGNGDGMQHLLPALGALQDTHVLARENLRSLRARD